MNAVKSDIQRGTTNRIEITGACVALVRHPLCAGGYVVKDVLTISQRRDGLFSIYSPKVRGGNGRGVTAAPGSWVVTLYGHDIRISELYSQAGADA